MKKLILIGLLLSFSACKKEESVVLFAQQATGQIQAAIQKVSIVRTRVYTNNLEVDFSTDPVSFEGDFIIVGQSRYNLNRLIRYAVFNSQGQTLFLYF
ncbi:hypothetical protein [Fibrivirga algicola]|uniref:Uncharacterized protein n=1 Tax=Fibrivirga algicola TaxID=2950420 RepID=A0ABX0QSC6_9BACT|nr:hypothetical protein [Fibrivirga algicola]NID13443.1 hypothetical protein [Fibrivirga algicola]